MTTIWWENGGRGGAGGGQLCLLKNAKGRSFQGEKFVSINLVKSCLLKTSGGFFFVLFFFVCVRARDLSIWVPSMRSALRQPFILPQCDNRGPPWLQLPTASVEFFFKSVGKTSLILPKNNEEASYRRGKLCKCLNMNFRVFACEYKESLRWNFADWGLLETDCTK